MSILLELKMIQSNRGELRKFGYTVGGVLAILGGFMRLKGNPVAILMFGIAGFLILGAALFPAILLPFQKIWMGFAVIMGNIMSRIILALTFYAIITPIGLITKLAGKDFLERKLDPDAETYWHYRDQTTHDTASYENQF